MRILACLFVLMLVGCSSGPEVASGPHSNQNSKVTSGDPWINPFTKQTADDLEVYPFMVNLPRKGSYDPYSDYLLPLLDNLSQQALYRIKNGYKLRSGYRYIQQVSSKDRSKTVLTLRQRGTASWGYVTTSIGRSGVANAFVVDEGGVKHYVLVLKRMRICLVSKAEGVPRWRNGKWQFAKMPGIFECTGSSRLNVFQKTSGFPGLLGPYFDENDTVLVFKKPSELKGVLFALKQQFPQLKVPQV